MRYLTLIASLMCMALSVSAAKADRRVAFVVGNGSYKNVAQLPNPPIDAKAMAATLRNVGFDVIEGSNLSRDQMTEKLLDFGRKAQGSDIALFYYAGHGIASAAPTTCCRLTPTSSRRWTSSWALRSTST
ncbi:putative caspase-like protein [Bradyrhizobium diazoefficiens]